MLPLYAALESINSICSATRAQEESRIVILANTASVPNSKTNAEVFLAIENYKTGNSVIFHDDNSLIKRWGVLTMFFEAKPLVIHQIWRYSYIHTQCERECAKNVIAIGQWIALPLNYQQSCNCFSPCITVSMHQMS